MFTESLLEKLTEHGIAGILLALAILAMWHLNKQLDVAQKARATEVEASQKAHLAGIQEVQKLRVDDQKAYQTQLVDLIKNCTIAITSGSNAATAEKEAMGELRESLEKFVEETRRNTPRRQ